MDNGMERLVEGTAIEAQKARRKSLTKAQTKYMTANYDRVTVMMRKGLKERIKAVTDKSINKYILDLIEEDLAKHEEASQ